MKTFEEKPIISNPLFTAFIWTLKAGFGFGYHKQGVIRHKCGHHEILFHFQQGVNDSYGIWTITYPISNNTTTVFFFVGAEL